MQRWYYSSSIIEFLHTDTDIILAKLVRGHSFPLELTERDAWKEEINTLKNTLHQFKGKLYLEYSIPRM